MTRRAKLTPEAITEAAIVLIDTMGAGAFSMRKLAAAMRVDPMALYHHHANRDALMGAVMQALLGRVPRPAPGPDWRADLRALCHGLRAVAQRHPGCFRIYETYGDWIEAEQHLIEACHAILARAGLPDRMVVRAAQLFLAYTESFAVDEINGLFDIEERASLLRAMQGGAFPATQALSAALLSADADADFETGLDIMIRGLSAPE